MDAGSDKMERGRNNGVREDENKCRRGGTQRLACLDSTVLRWIPVGYSHGTFNPPPHPREGTPYLTHPSFLPSSLGHWRQQEAAS